MRSLLALLAAALIAAPLPAAAQPAYTELKPAQQVPEGNKIDVIEFFWYGCIHCYNLEPVLNDWLKRLPQDAQFRRVPAVFNERWAYDARIFYAMESMGLVEKLHQPLFDAIHRHALRTNNPEAFAAWLKKHGVEPKKFVEVMNSFAVQSKTRRAAAMTAAYKIDGTPAMAVDGRYTVSASQARTQQGMLETVSYLIEMARKAK